MTPAPARRPTTARPALVEDAPDVDLDDVPEPEEPEGEDGGLEQARGLAAVGGGASPREETCGIARRWIRVPPLGQGPRPAVAGSTSSASRPRESGPFRSQSPSPSLTPKAALWASWWAVFSGARRCS